ncbi:hypothetical protein D8S78_20870 [Natrialba swarupiae]|nr:hypothetical protein [Natrialba swarupiae]
MLTHREFYHRYRANVTDATPLLTVTIAYERAVFTADPVSQDDAEAVLRTAKQLCSTDSSVSGDGHRRNQPTSNCCLSGFASRTRIH